MTSRLINSMKLGLPFKANLHLQSGQVLIKSDERSLTRQICFVSHPVSTIGFHDDASRVLNERMGLWP